MNRNVFRGKLLYRKAINSREFEVHSRKLSFTEIGWDLIGKPKDIF